MKNKISCMVLSCIIVLSFSLAACGPAETPQDVEGGKVSVSEKEEEVTKTPVTPTEEPGQEEVVSSDVPRYGGQITLSLTSDPTNFDEAINRTMAGSTYGLTHEELSMWDWSKGPSGTGELLMTYSGFHRQQYNVGSMAESWEIEPPDHIRLHIRQGVHFSLNPNFEASRLVGGREMTAEDVAFTFNRLFSEQGAYLYNSYRPLADVIQVTATDKYTVDINFTPETFMQAYHTLFTFAHVVAPELVEEYGDVNDWKRVVGTGPFMINDYVPGSLVNYIKNPNYWMKNPVEPGKGDQLPYVDTVKLLTIPDLSTRQAALRTGKIDELSAYTLEDRDFTVKNTPELLYHEYWSHGGQALGMHIYDENLPFKDVKVRRAMVMAIDYKTIVDTLYGGAAEYFNWPFSHLKDYENIWIPLEEMPESVQELYTYNPEKAKRLLAEAGYPEGFKTSIVFYNTATNTDYLSIIKDYWQKVGIELILEPKERAVHSTLWRQFTYPEMVMASAGGIGSYYRLIGFSGTDYWNPSQVNEPYIEDVAKEMADIILTTFDWEEIDRLYRELIPKVIDQAYMIPTPTQHSYVLWWPWLKNYSGELNTSFAGPSFGWTRFVWIEQDMKESMGY